MHFLDAPAVRNEIPGQEVEELRVRWLFAEMAEIVWSPYDSASEMALPNTIDEYARNQRIVRLRQPFSQRRAAAGRVWRLGDALDLRRRFAQQGEKTRLDGHSGLVLGNHHGRGDGPDVRDQHGIGQALRFQLIVFRYFLLERI